MCENPCNDYDEWCDSYPCEDGQKQKANCPFCDCMPRYEFDTSEGVKSVSCANASCALYGVRLTPEAWSKRPAEEKMKDKVANLNSQVLYSV